VMVSGAALSRGADGVVAPNDGGVVGHLLALLTWLFALLNPARWLGAGGQDSGASSETHRSDVAQQQDPQAEESSTGERVKPSTNPSRRGGTKMAGGGKKVTLAQMDRDDDDKETNERWNGDSTNLM